MSDTVLATAAEFLMKGNLVVFPTETVYGIGADATNELACSKIFQVKNRPVYNPLIVHLANLEQAQKIAIFNETAFKLTKFWPGPMTLVLPLKDNSEVKITRTVTAGLNTVALRVPANDLAVSLIKKTGRPIAAPSANPSGYLSPTSCEHLKEHFHKYRDKIYFIRGDNCQYGLESTIIDATDSTPIILRPGFITAEDIQTATKILPKFLDKKVNLIKSPGMLLKHYSPRTKIRLNAKDLMEKEVGLNFGKILLKGNYNLNLSAKADLAEAAYNFYGMLHLLDAYALKNQYTIAVASIPNCGIGIAINDKLSRASI